MRDPALPRAGSGAAARLDRNFWWLVSGSFISMLGDQFTLVALPWLVLKLTGSALALGTVLMALPRATFMLVGGAFVHRFSPHRVLIISRSANAVLIGVLAAFVWTGAIQLWWLYLLALGIGFATAFVYPAGSAILPQIVSPAKLTAANGVTMGGRSRVCCAPLARGYARSGGIFRSVPSCSTWARCRSSSAAPCKWDCPCSPTSGWTGVRPPMVR